jgi:hypothetical protein
MNTERSDPTTMTTGWDRTIPGETDLDLAILREMYPNGHIGASGIDPRLNPSRISRRLGVRRATIAERLRTWSQYGFLVKFDVWPNPALFRHSTHWLDLRAAGRIEKPAVLERIGLAPGAVMALDSVGD